MFALIIQNIFIFNICFSALSNDLDRLESSFDAVIETTDVWADPVLQENITRINNKNFTSTNNIQDKTDWSILYWQADEDGLYDINYSYSQAQNKVLIYSSDVFSSASYVKKAEHLTYAHHQAEVNAGQYIVAQSWSMTFTLEIKRKTDATYSIPEIEALAAIRYDIAQTLTDEQKQQVRENIGTGEVDDTLSVEGMAADAKKTGDELNELSNTIALLVDKSFVFSETINQSDLTSMPGKAHNKYGNIIDKDTWSGWCFEAPVTGRYKIMADGITASVDRYLFIYNSSTFNNTTVVEKVTRDTASNSAIFDMIKGQYFCITAFDTNFTIVVSYATQYSLILKNDIPLTESMMDGVDGLVESKSVMVLQNIDDGWTTLPVDNFSPNDWQSYNNPSSNRLYRVHYDYPIIFSREVNLLAKRGFYISGFYSDGTYVESTCCINLPPNTLIKLHVRRIVEDTSEIADIAEFASALLVSTCLSDMERFKSTFTDITMFPRIGISGDSFSAGGGMISGVRPLTWGKNLERESGVVVDIYAKSGIGIQEWTSDESNGLPALLAGEQCGLYWFAHGINGTGTDTALGTPEDMSQNPKPLTFYGQYVYAIETIKNTLPQARIVIATIVGTSYELNQTQYKIVNVALQNIAEHCEVPLIDLTEDDFYKSQWYRVNHLSNHPTAMLNAGIAHANRRLFAKCVMDNPDYFRDYGNKYVFPVSCPNVTGGIIHATPNITASGETVSLSNTPFPGYMFVRYESDDVTISNNAFMMPSTKVTVRGVFEASV